ncbi:MAG: alpha/beta hydrolase [Clostridia bacterium]
MKNETACLFNNPTLEGLASFYPNVPFAQPGGYPLALQLLLPRDIRPILHPLLVFIQGSAWKKPDMFAQIPQLSALAKRGYVVASVTHRSCFEAKAPAFLEDVQSAIRFLCDHAADYNIDTDHIGVWGTSSGGNTALLVGLSGTVHAVVDCFGPTDLPRMVREQYAFMPEELKRMFDALAGGPVHERENALIQISPYHLLRERQKLPPFLLLHGDADPIVPYQHTADFYQKLLSLGHEASLYRIKGAEHEGSFWSTECLQIIENFFDAKLLIN